MWSKLVQLISIVALVCFEITSWPILLYFLGPRLVGRPASTSFLPRKAYTACY